jgi:hypothetical protein
MQLQQLTASLFARASDLEARLVVRPLGGEGAAWDLAVAAAVASQLPAASASPPVACPTVAVWEEDAVTVRADPLQQVAAGGVVAVAADADGRLTLVRARANPRWRARGSEAAGMRLEQVMRAVRAGAEQAADEVRRLVLPVASATQSEKAAGKCKVEVGRGLAHRLRNRQFARELAAKLGMGADQQLRERDGFLEVPEEATAVLEEVRTWDSCPVEGWTCLVDQVVAFGFFVKAVPGGEALAGVTGLVHWTRAAAGGGKMPSYELKDLPIGTEVVVRLLEWSPDGKPVLERIK